MGNKRSTAAWRYARESYEKTRSKHGRFGCMELNEENCERVIGRVEWLCLLYVLFCLEPSMDTYNPRMAYRFIQTLIREQRFDSLCCLAEYLVVHWDENPVSREMGLKVLRMLAEAGHVLSQRLLGIILIDGIGTGETQKEALSLLVRAAEANDSEAQLALAYRYLLGETVSQDETKAYYWARKAETQIGNVDEFWNLWKKKSRGNLK